MPAGVTLAKQNVMASTAARVQEAIQVWVIGSLCPERMSWSLLQQGFKKQ